MRRAIILLFILLALGGALWTYFIYGPKNISLSSREGTVASQLEGQIPIIHAYNDGIHRFTGTIRLPHSCYALHASTTYVPGNTESPGAIEVALITTDLETGERTCFSIPTSYAFDVAEEGLRDATLRVTVNGEPTLFRLTER